MKITHFYQRWNVNVIHVCWWNSTNTLIHLFTLFIAKGHHDFQTHRTIDFEFMFRTFENIFNNNVGYEICRFNICKSPDSMFTFETHKSNLNCLFRIFFIHFFFQRHFSEKFPGCKQNRFSKHIMFQIDEFCNMKYFAYCLVCFHKYSKLEFPIVLRAFRRTLWFELNSTKKIEKTDLDNIWTVFEYTFRQKVLQNFIAAIKIQFYAFWQTKLFKMN